MKARIVNDGQIEKIAEPLIVEARNSGMIVGATVFCSAIKNKIQKQKEEGKNAEEILTEILEMCNKA